MKRYLKILSLTFVCILSICQPNSAHSQELKECSLDEKGGMSWDTLNKSAKGKKVDGRGGIDTIRMIHSSTIVARAKRLISVEIMNIRNDMFTTLIIDAEILLSAENNEVEVVSDWFDQVILDPRYTWTSQVDHAFTGRLFQTTHNGATLTLRTQLDTFVVAETGLGIVTQEGPFGSPMAIRKLSSAPKTTLTRSADGQQHAELVWTAAGMYVASLPAEESDASHFTLNAKNDLPNVILMDLNELIGSSERTFVFEADPQDRLVFTQPSCWGLEQDVTSGNSVATALAHLPQRITVAGENHHLRQDKTNSFTTANGRRLAFGIRHIDADVAQVIDQINLQDSKKDILLLRHSPYLRRDHPIFVGGDPGIDEVWLEGSAGWELEFRDTGIFATVPADVDQKIVLSFMPDLKVKILPVPRFLSDPNLLEYPFYPAIQDREYRQKELLVSRGGVVGFSAKQLTNTRRLGFFNGAANLVRISPSIFANSAAEVQIDGEPGLDQLLLVDMPEPSRDPDGNLTWIIDRPDLGIQTISASGFSLITTENFLKSD